MDSGETAVLTWPKERMLMCVCVCVYTRQENNTGGHIAVVRQRYYSLLQNEGKHGAVRCGVQVQGVASIHQSNTSFTHMVLFQEQLDD